jgi:hypothetical protein
MDDAITLKGVRLDLFPRKSLALGTLEILIRVPPYFMETLLAEFPDGFR